MFQRALSLPGPGQETFFLWGPRQTGKSTLLKQRYPQARRIDLLKADEFRRYAAAPEGDELSYWRLAGGTEVDFVLGDMRLAVEAKASARIAGNHLKGLRSLAAEHPGVGRRVAVCLEPRARRTEDGIDVLPATEFARRLWRGDLARPA